jgi:hypothetical protein
MHDAIITQYKVDARGSSSASHFLGKPTGCSAI